MITRAFQVLVVGFLFGLPVDRLVAATLPTEEEVKGIQTLCGAGTVQSGALKANVDAAIASWRKASAGTEIEAAKTNLAGALSRVRDDSNLAPVYKVYIDCVKDTIQQFLDKEKNTPKPQKISTQTYLEMANPKVDAKTWTGPGSPVEFYETLRGYAEMVKGEMYWIPPPNQILKGGSSFRGCCNRPQLWLKENGDSARSQSPLMQINADTVCLVRTQFWQINSFISSQKASLN